MNASRVNSPYRSVKFAVVATAPLVSGMLISEIDSWRQSPESSASDDSMIRVVPVSDLVSAENERNPLTLNLMRLPAPEMASFWQETTHKTASNAKSAQDDNLRNDMLTTNNCNTTCKVIHFSGYASLFQFFCRSYGMMK